MRSPKPVTPDEAMAVWSSIPNPSARRVAKALNQAGRRVHHSTIARWNAQGLATGGASATSVYVGPVQSVPVSTLGLTPPLTVK
jgi:hypothetical protein